MRQLSQHILESRHVSDGTTRSPVRSYADSRPRSFNTIRSFLDRFRLPITGTSDHLRRYIETRICAMRLISVVYIPICLLTAASMVFAGDRTDLTGLFLIPVEVGAWIPHLIIVVAMLSLLLPRGSLHARTGLMLCTLWGAGSLIGVGLLQGFSGIDVRLIGYALAYFIVCAVSPLSTPILVTLLLLGLATAMTSWALVTPDITQNAYQLLFLIASIAFGALGLAFQVNGRLSFMMDRKAQLLIVRRTKQLQRAQSRMEQLLSETLTGPVARILQEQSRFPPIMDEVVIITTDVVGFSAHCRQRSAKDMVSLLERFFQRFDGCCQRWHVEPVGSQGDNRLGIAGQWIQASLESRSTRVPAVDAIMAMLEFRDCLAPSDRADSDSDRPLGIWPARIGIHLGPAMMGVIRSVRLSFSIWGEAVNTAARLEQAADPNTILVSGEVVRASRGLFDFDPIKPRECKEGQIAGAQVVGVKPQFLNADGQVNQAFWDAYHDPDRIF
jgi:class 3 adenylate cyclase